MFSRQPPAPQTRHVSMDGHVPIDERYAPAPARPPHGHDDVIGSPGTVPPPRAAADQPPPPPEPRATGDVVLSRAYQAHGEPVQRLTFRAPTTGDLQKVNAAPFKFILGERLGEIVIEEVETNWKAVAQYVVLLATPPLPPSTVDKFTLDDLDTCAEALVPFFMTKSAFRMPSMQRIGSQSTTT